MTNANSAAFPSYPIEGGLTKREYFAALAMQGILANPGSDFVYSTDTDVVTAAVLFADKLLARLGSEE